MAKGMKLGSYLWNSSDPETWPVGDGVQGTQVQMDNDNNDFFNGGSVSLDADGNTVLIYNTSDGCSSMNLTDKITVRPDELVTYGTDTINDAIRFELLDSSGAVLKDESIQVKIAKDQLTNTSYGAKSFTPGSKNVMLYQADYYRRGLTSIGSGTATITLGIPECVDNITNLVDVSNARNEKTIPATKWTADYDNHTITITDYEFEGNYHFKLNIFGDISDSATVGRTYYADTNSSVTRFEYTDTYNHGTVTYDITEEAFTNISRYAVKIVEGQESLMLSDYRSPVYADFPDGYPSLFGLVRNFYTSNEQTDDQMITWEFDADTLDVIGVFFPLDPDKSESITVTDVVFNDGTERHGLDLSFDKFTTSSGTAYSIRYLNVADIKERDPSIPESAKYITSITANCGKFSQGFATDTGYGKPVGYFNRAVVDAGEIKDIEYRFKVNDAPAQTLQVTYDPAAESACLSLTNTTYSGENRQATSTSFKAGETIYMSTKVSVGSGLLSTPEPRLYIVVPQWMSFDPESVRAREWITSTSSTNPTGGSDYFDDEDIRYSYSYVKNAAGENFTCYEFYVEGSAVGGFLERPDPAYVKWSGQNNKSIVFEYPLTIEDTATTQTIDFNDYLMTGKGDIKTGRFLPASGHASGYSHADSWDFDGDGNRSEADVVVSVPKNSSITILDNMNITVSGYLTHQGSSDAINPYDPGSDGSNEVNVVEFMPGDDADYHVIVANTLLSTGATCSVNAYIPIPNGSISGSEFTPINTNPQLTNRWYQFDEYKWPMELRGLIDNSDPNTFDIVYYLDAVTLGQNGMPSADVTKVNPESLTAAELDRVVLVEIKSKDNIKIPNGRFEFTLPLKVGADESQATAAGLNLEKNIFRPRYHREGGIGAVWVDGNYVAARLAVSSIGGNVFNDANGNGHWDDDEDGIDGALVELFDSTGQRIAEKETSTVDGKAGKYTFASEDNEGRQLPAGKYIVKVTNPDTGSYIFTRHVPATQANYKTNSEAIAKENNAYAEMEISIPYDGVLSGYQEYQNAGLFIDKVGAGDDGNSPDGIPDACEVRVNYAAENGTIGSGQKTFEYFYKEDENGGYKRTFDLNITAPPQVVPNTGCVLDHWENTKDDATNDDGKFTFDGVAGGTTITVKAVHAEKYYSVSYNSNVPSEIPDEQALVTSPPLAQIKKKDANLTLSDEVQECYDMSTDPDTRYTFLGWNTMKDGSGTMYQPGDVYSEDADVILYAQWNREALQPYDVYQMTEKKVSDDWEVKDNYEVHSSHVLYGRVGDPMEGESTQIAGFEFILELTEGDPDDYKVTAEDPATGDRSWVRFYYRRNSYTLSFNSNGGTPVASITKKYEADITAPEDPTREGYIFKGWDQNIPETMPAENMTLNAIWEEIPPEYTITFKDHDGTVLGTSTGVEGSHYDVPEVKTRPGYNFTGWDPDLPEEGIPDEDMTVTAQYEPREYQITYTLNGGTASGNPTRYNIESGKITLIPPEKPGYTFAGWTGTGIEGGPQKDVTIPAGSIGDRSYTANWPSEAEYIVKHYKQNLDGTYPDEPDLEETKYGSIGEETVAEAKTYEGFTAASFDQVTITDTSGGDDPVVVEIYYPRNEYTFTWLDEDGTTVLDSTTAKYGAQLPAYSKATPTKESTPQYTYSFKEWTTEDEPGDTVDKDVTYKATYNESLRKYTITFENEDGTTLQSSEVEYGQTPAYTGETPTKENDAQYSYEFDKWTPDIEAVTGEQTYTATYRSTTKSYTVKWVDEDGETVIDSKTVEYGQPVPEFAGTQPTKEATAEFTYTFDKWVPDAPVGDTVTGEITFTASYTETKNKYKITFVGEDDNVLQETMVEYGTVPEYKGETPTKPSTAEHTYVFNGWDPAEQAVTGEQTYKATFTETKNRYEIKWVDEDGETVIDSKTVEYGQPVPEFAGTQPTKDPTAEFTYTFDKWVPDAPVGDTVTGEITFTVSYTETKNKYKITFVDDDDNVLQETMVEYGQTPAYTGETPSKEGTDEYTYIFNGWDPAEHAVTGEQTYKATFIKEQKPTDPDQPSDDEVLYEFTRGENSSWKQEDGKGAAFTVSRSVDDDTAFDHFKGIEVDGVLVDDANYNAEPGSVKLALTSAYIDSLAVGKHTLKALFDDGSAETSFYVLREGTTADSDASDKTSDGSGGDSTKTGDDSSIAIYILTMLASIAGAAAMFIRSRRRV